MSTEELGHLTKTELRFYQLLRLSFPFYCPGDILSFIEKPFCKLILEKASNKQSEKIKEILDILKQKLEWIIVLESEIERIKLNNSKLDTINHVDQEIHRLLQIREDMINKDLEKTKSLIKKLNE